MQRRQHAASARSLLCAAAAAAYSTLVWSTGTASAELQHAGKACRFQPVLKALIQPTVCGLPTVMLCRCAGGRFSTADPPKKVECPSGMTTVGLRATSSRSCGEHLSDVPCCTGLRSSTHRLGVFVLKGASWPVRTALGSLSTVQ